MQPICLQLAFVVALVGVLAVAVRRLRGVAMDPYPDPDIDVGTVSEGWLAEQRGSRTDRVSS